jgi:tetratricopeptide (TPR) repeat protein
MWGGANRSAFLSGSALACLAANALPEAGELSAAAVRNSDLSATAAATRARVLVSLGDVRGALEQSERALDLDSTLPLAWEVRAEALLHAGRRDDAYAAAQRAAALAPGDVGALWLAARAANAARAFQTEAELPHAGATAAFIASISGSPMQNKAWLAPPCANWSKRPPLQTSARSSAANSKTR